MQQSADALKELLQKKGPFNLSELRLASCEISSNVVKDLFLQLRERSSLQKLELSNANLDNGIIKDMQMFIETNMRLEELDISWNKLCP